VKKIVSINHGREVPYSLRASECNLGALAIIMNFSTLMHNILFFKVHIRYLFNQVMFIHVLLNSVNFTAIFFG
jgi:hypothetical protein